MDRRRRQRLYGRFAFITFEAFGRVRFRSLRAFLSSFVWELQAVELQGSDFPASSEVALILDVNVQSTSYIHASACVLVFP